MANLFDMTPFQQYGLGNGFNYRDSLSWLFGTGAEGMPGFQQPPMAPNAPMAPQVNPAAPQIPPMPGNVPMPPMGGGGMPPMGPPPIMPPMAPPPMGMPPMVGGTGNAGRGLMGGGARPAPVGRQLGKGAQNK